MQTEPSHVPVESNSSAQPPLAARRKTSVILLLSLIFGVLGGICGAVYMLKSPNLQKISGIRATTDQSSIQRGSYKENSSVIDVVKTASPAVVSIIVSKDLSQEQSSNQNPFSDDPFLSPFFRTQDSSQNQTPDVREVGAGSGFFVTSDGMIVTNRHVVEDEQAAYTVITADGTSYDATVLARDSVNDLAILKVDAKNAPVLALSDSSQLEIGQQAVAIGNSLGQYQNTVTSGIVSGIGRSITAGGNGTTEQLEGVVQTDAAINPGNSGGPLLNLAGQVIGVNTAIDQEGQSVGFAIPSNDIARAVESFQKNGRIIRPFLGVRYLAITKAIARASELPKDYGALIIGGRTSSEPAVLSGSPAAKAGLRENDIIMEVNGQRVDEDNTLSKRLKSFNVGDSISLKIFRDDNEQEISVTLEEMR